MKTYRTDIDTAIMVANSGVDFFEDTSKHEGIWCGFMPHNEGCKVAAVKIVDVDGNEAATPSWVGTTLDLDCYISAGVVISSSGNRRGYITEFTLTSGAATLVKDNEPKINQ